MSFYPMLLSALKMNCPVCYKGKLFSRYLKLNSCCKYCSADLEKYNSGDGPAFFVMTLVGTIACIVMVYTEMRYQPAVWVHMIIQISLILGLSFILLPLVKSLLLHLQIYFNAYQAGDSENPNDTPK